MKKNKSLKSRVIALVLVSIACGVLGYFCGRIAGKLTRWNEDTNLLTAMMEDFSHTADHVVPVLYLLVMIATLVISAVVYAGAARRFRNLPEDDEDGLTRIERRLNLPITLVSVSVVLNMLFFSLIAEIVFFGDLTDTAKEIVFYGTMALFIVSLVTQVVISRKCVELVKKMNPEKRGEVLALSFQKEWEDSCDEAQKAILYRSAWKAYKITNYTCMALWVVCVISQMVFYTGVFPVICVSLIWLIQMVVYSTESARLEQ